MMEYTLSATARTSRPVNSVMLKSMQINISL